MKEKMIKKFGNEKNMDLSKHEKQVLMLLLDKSRISDSDIAEKIGITFQAVGLIRKKLEREEVIKKYTCQIDYGKIGLHLFAVVIMKQKNTNEGKSKLEMLGDLPEVVFSCMLRGLNTSIVLYAFRDSEEMDKYFEVFQKSFHKYIDIVDFHPFSVYNLTKSDFSPLFKLVLEGKEIIPPIGYNLVEKK